jgi:hypothetical protein
LQSALWRTWRHTRDGHRFAQSHIVDLFGAGGSAPSKQPSAAVAGLRRRHLREAAPTSFTPALAHAMFVGLETNADGFLCAQDLEAWLAQQAAAAKGCSAARRDAGGSSMYALRLGEVAAFLRRGAAGPLFLAPPPAAAKSRRRVRFSEDGGVGGVGGDGPLDLAATATATASGAAKDHLLSEDGLAACLARFPTLAFDWDAPIGVLPGGGGAFARGGGAFQAQAQSRAFSREAAANLFRRLDSDGDGWVRAADLRVWRRMLPLGRSEDALVCSVLAGAKAAAAVAPTPRATPRGKAPTCPRERRWKLQGPSKCVARLSPRPPARSRSG